MSKFTERLWQDIVREHGDDLAQIHRPARRRSWRTRPRLLAGTGLGAMAAGTLATLALGAASSSPAFAVTRNPDGTVSVEIMRVAGIQGANAKLAALGLRARFVQVTVGCAPARQLLETGNRLARPQSVLKALAGAGWVHAQIDPRKIPAGKVLVVTTERNGRAVQLRAVNVRVGMLRGCMPLPFAAERLQTAAGNGLVHCAVGPPVATPVPGTGTTGTTGNSGTPPTGNSGTAPPPTLPQTAPAVPCLAAPPCAPAAAAARGQAGQRTERSRKPAQHSGKR